MEANGERDNAEFTDHATSREDHQEDPELVEPDPSTQIQSSDDDAACPGAIESDLQSHPPSAEEIPAACLTSYLGDMREQLKASSTLSELQIRKILGSLVKSAPFKRNIIAASFSDAAASSKPTTISSLTIKSRMQPMRRDATKSLQLGTPTTATTIGKQPSSNQGGLSLKLARGQSFSSSPFTDQKHTHGVTHSRRLAPDKTIDGLKKVFSTNAQQTAQSSTSPPPERSSSKLLGLPAELRNRIYRFALIEPKTIELDKSKWPAHQPAVLKTCRQIRHEALGVFYFGNKISTEILAWNPAVKDKFNQLMTTYGTKSPQLSHYFKGGPNWANLLGWLKAVHERRIGGISDCVGKQRSQERKVVGILFMIVRKTRVTMPWSEVVTLLEAHREVIGQIDAKWLL